MRIDTLSVSSFVPHVLKALEDFSFFPPEAALPLARAFVGHIKGKVELFRNPPPVLLQLILPAYSHNPFEALRTVYARAFFLCHCAQQMEFFFEEPQIKVYPYLEVEFCPYCPTGRAGKTRFVHKSEVQKHPLLACSSARCEGSISQANNRHLKGNKLSSLPPVRLDLDSQLGRMSPLMKSFPIRLWAEYMHRHFPMTKRPAVVNMGPRDIRHVFEDIERKYRPENGFDDFEEYGRDHDAAYWLDDCLMEMAFCGDIEPLLKLTPSCRDELWLRAKYALHAIENGLFDAEEHQSEMPAHAPDKIKHCALMLYALAGPARDIPEEWLMAAF